MLQISIKIIKITTVFTTLLLVSKNDILLQKNKKSDCFVPRNDLLLCLEQLTTESELKSD